MTTEQTTYIKIWMSQKIYIKEERWLEKDLYDEYDFDNLWDVDEESYKMKKFLRNSIDVEYLSSDEQALVDKAFELCSYIDELCGIMLYATPEDWDPAEN